MTGEEEEINPLSNILYRKKNSPNIPNRPNRLGRSPTSFWILPNIAEGFREYAKFTGKSIGECLESALIEYMKNNQVQQVTINVTKDMRSILPNLNNRLRQKITKNQLGEKLDLIIRLHEIGNEHEIQRNHPNFQKAVEKALRIKRPDKELIELLKKSEDYL